MNWTDSTWQATVTDWMNTQLHRLSLPALTDFKAVIVSPTSSVFRARSGGRLVYFKASTSPFTFEPRLTDALAEKSPGAIPTVLAIDTQRAWMLLADGGTTLRQLTLTEERHVIDGALTHWRVMLSRFAALQQAALPYLDELQASGCPSRRLAELPGLYRALIVDTPILTLGKEDALNQTQIDRLLAFAIEVERLCAELSAYSIPETLHHDDLGANNVLFDGQTYRFFDWAESAIAHPFFSLTIVLRFARYVVQWDETTLNDLRDTYLSAWLDYAPMDKLHEAWILAHRLSKLCRALTWHTVEAHLNATARLQNGGSTPYWLRLFVDDVDD